jgi:heat shock transcription factor
VLDEDEFARTLIPELFKHNNYASFVRQLNMYGFHKKVGLSDNSMKASELKSKAPSEYYNKYFKRGRPELLWLIQKPKNASHPKRKRDEDGKHGDSEDERKYAQEAGGTGAYGEDLAVRGNQEMAMIPRTEYNSLRNEVRALQQQQKAISNVLTSIRRQNDQLYQQATAFQTLHERHENSINAILTFLATFYNRSLEGGSGTNLADLFHPNMTQQQPRGNVVDVDDFPDKDFGNKSSQMQIQRPGRRSLALLPAPLAKDSATKGDRAATLSPPILPAGASSKPKAANRPPVFRSPTMSRSTSASVGLGTLPGTSSRSSTLANVETPPTPTPQAPQPLPENEEIMSHIQNVNANTSQAATQIPYLDNLSAALANYQTQGGNMPLTPQQRNDMLSLMANNVSAASPNSQLAQNSNNAMVNPQPPAIPDLPEIHETQNQLELLRRLSDGTSNRIQHLQERLQPLSPSGHIPGIGEENSYFDNVPLGEPAHYDLDMESFVNDDFFPSANPTVSGAAATDGQNGAVPATAGPADTNLSRLNLDDLNDTGHTDAAIDSTNLNDDDDDLFGENSANDDGGQIESLSSSTTSPAVAAGVGDNVEEQNTRSPKRMRK